MLTRSWKRPAELPAIPLPCNRRELLGNSHTPCQYDAMSGDTRQFKVREAYLHVPRHEVNNAILARYLEFHPPWRKTPSIWHSEWLSPPWPIPGLADAFKCQLIYDSILGEKFVLCPQLGYVLRKRTKIRLIGTNRYYSVLVGDIPNTGFGKQIHKEGGTCDMQLSI